MPVAATAAKWEPDVFPISHWCGVPVRFISLERYQEVADAGFTTITTTTKAATRNRSPRASNQSSTATWLGIKQRRDLRDRRASCPLP